MSIPKMGIDIMGVDILGIDILALPRFRQGENVRGGGGGANVRLPTFSSLIKMRIQAIQ